ncbi:threonyl-tRNA synthetase [Klosneuvirus KNV1]|uniref:threonine--tRNA ligase n=1 Tax=Klosneuvirus KNV1 TaxID=1977640 RepID=A0A1V0SKZ9_9VIRU|nr:threonyl-tRNA synthetase [Klosneuvirus KNV1]
MTEEIIDHRKIGITQELFFFSEHSPGSTFWLPNGTIIYNKLQQFIRDEYYKRGFQEVKSPIIAKSSLWKISSHWQVYKKNMFCFDCDNDVNEDDKDNNQVNEDDKDNNQINDDENMYAMSAMNCPKHCLIYQFHNRSYRELPLRFADFGSLHRNELRGALTGLTRTKCFAQDDAHVFCTQSQIKSEMKSCLEFLNTVYGIFGYHFDVKLSTRPDQYIGELAVWDLAEKQLAEVLNESGLKWEMALQDGAFYGPKIDIQLTDSLNRKHQCATIQLDFNLPERFKLEYVDEKGQSQRPVMIHRAIYGSFERFIAILLEHTNGKLPFWLNYHQVAILPITDKFNEYAHQVKNRLMEHKYYVDVDDSDLLLNKKVSNAQLKHYNYILVVGKNEQKNNTVSIRYRDNDVKKVVLIDDLISELVNNVKEFK